ncbi:hypothetical protein VKT23_002119 [Stygiomarasmius scandens]|uniref:F-box domain-containing protein n=1 Tax=Marasmiellus scandens TaxID=2682957 RepID=A0ABR1K284_9AGAR
MIAGLLQLPNELLFVILHELDLLSLVHCTEVCRALHSIVDSSSLLQYRLHLALSGMKDGPPGIDGTITRLNKLKAHQEAWQNVKWSTRQTFPLQSVQLWELAGGILAFTHCKKSFTFIQLPSIYRGIKQKEWNIEVDNKFDVADFSMDISNDLLVLIVKGNGNREETLFKIHLLSLSTGKPHPSTSSPILDFQSRAVDDEWTFEIRISGQYLGIMFSGLITEKLVMWNWQNGTFLQYRKEIVSFAFLTDELVLMSQIRDGLHLELIVVDINVRNGYLCRLDLPDPHDDMDIFDISIHSESYRCHSGNVPFTTSFDDRLFVVFYTLFNIRTEGGATYALFIPLSTIMSVIERQEIDHTWQSWGPKGSRMLQLGCPADVWVCYMHGLKAAVFEKDTKEIQLLDFNQLALKYDLAKNEQSQTKLLPEETVISGAFMKSVHTSLGGRVRTVALPADSAMAVMFSEDALLVICRDDESDTEREDMVVFSF